jgi:N-acyl-D-amino-acid deacylase
VELSRVAADLGGIYHTHVRYQLGDRFLDPFREALEIGERSGCPVHLTHLYRRTSARGGSAALLELVDRAAARGIEVTFDTYPWEWSGTRLPMLLPLWAQEGTPEQILDTILDPRNRDRLRADVDRRGESYAGADIWARIRLCGFQTQENVRYEGWSLAQIMTELELAAADTIIHLLSSEDFGVSQVAPGPHGASIPSFLVHPRAMIGSDSVFVGEYPSPRSYGTFPRVLGEFVRDEAVLSLTEAVRKMTSLPAMRLGLPDRGLIKDGFYADLVVFDPAIVKHRASYENPRVHPEGIHHVFVNGVPTLLSGDCTGSRPGHALRRR